MMEIIKPRLKDAEAETIATSRSPSCSLRGFRKHLSFSLSLSLSLLYFVSLFTLPFSAASSCFIYDFRSLPIFNRSSLFLCSTHASNLCEWNGRSFSCSVALSLMGRELEERDLESLFLTQSGELNLDCLNLLQTKIVKSGTLRNENVV